MDIVTDEEAFEAFEKLTIGTYKEGLKGKYTLPKSDISPYYQYRIELVCKIYCNGFIEPQRSQWLKTVLDYLVQNKDKYDHYDIDRSYHVSL